jgi:hypothetical protein
MNRKSDLPLDEIDAVNRQARRQVDDIYRLLAPDLRGLMRAQVTAQSVSARVREMAADDRDLFNLKASLALADLTTLQDSLHQYRDLIAGEIRRHLCAQSAATAYVKSQRSTKNQRVN